MKLRVISGILMAAIFIPAVVYLDKLYYFIICVCGMIMLSEWFKMVCPGLSLINSVFLNKNLKTKSSQAARDLVGVKELVLLPYLGLGLLLVLIDVVCLCAIKYLSFNYSLVLLYFGIICSVDTFAFLGGKLIGGPKLASRISPNKTWSGLVVGVTAATIIAKLITLLPEFTFDSVLVIRDNLLVISCCLGLISQLSDLFISYFKRKFGIKDSGNIIPGHGGILDRLDGTILTSPVMVTLMFM